MRRAENPYLGFLFRCYSDPNMEPLRGLSTCAFMRP